MRLFFTAEGHYDNGQSRQDRRAELMDASIKAEIDAMDVEEMLRLWRFSKSGDPMFQGERGEYFKKVFGEKRNALPDGEWPAISKRVGW